jgi:peptidoglycan/LPS O-acetylase OafA/YrhL
MRRKVPEDRDMAIRAVRSWSEYRRALVIVAVIFLVIAVWGILTSEPGDHSTQYGMIVGCGLLVAVLLIGDAIQRRKNWK